MVATTGEIFLNLGIVTIIAGIAAFLLRLLKQPQILAYVLAGVLITPVFGIITDISTIESMSAIGVAFLLFLVGMEMDLKSLRSVALISTLGGSIQIAALFGLGYVVALLLGFLGLEAAYVGLMVSFSSTMVVMKLLSDKRELNTLHGRIVIGILLVEDIVAIFVLLLMTSISGFSLALLGFALLKFLLLFAMAFLASKYVFPEIFRFTARNQELLLIMALTVCFIFSFAFQYLGFSLAIGAFIAGIALGNLDYRLEIIGKVKSLRDFFALLFFVSLGMAMSVSVIQQRWLEFILLLLCVLLLKPFITMIICSIFRYTKKPSFLAASSLAQVGEFSLIIAAQGLALGHISQDFFSLIVLLAVVTITSTSYIIGYDHVIYKFLEKPLKIFDVFTTEGLEYLPTETKPSIVLCGHNRIGYSILRDLKKMKKKVLVVDYNPEVISFLVQEGFHCIYGDVTDEEIQERMNLSHLKLLISTVPDINDNFLLLKKVREVNKKAELLVTACTINDALELYDKGADYVILPHFLGGEHVSQMVSGLRTKKLKLHEERAKHLAHLRTREHFGHEHPQH